MWCVVFSPLCPCSLLPFLCTHPTHAYSSSRLVPFMWWWVVCGDGDTTQPKLQLRTDWTWFDSTGRVHILCSLLCCCATALFVPPVEQSERWRFASIVLTHLTIQCECLFYGAARRNATAITRWPLAVDARNECRRRRRVVPRNECRAASCEPILLYCALPLRGVAHSALQCERNAMQCNAAPRRAVQCSASARRMSLSLISPRRAAPRRFTLSVGEAECLQNIKFISDGHWLLCCCAALRALFPSSFSSRLVSFREWL